MNRRTAILAGIVVALLVAPATFVVASTATEATTSLSVPVGAVGDEADYIVRWHDRIDRDGNAIDERGHYYTGLRVDGTGSAQDTTQERRDVVFITDAWESGSTDIPPGSSTYAVDLANRATIEWRYSWDESSEAGTITDFGPWTDDPYISSDLSVSWTWQPAGPDMQGRVLTLGDDLTAQDLADGLEEALAKGGETTWWGQLPTRPITYAYERIVEGSGQIDGTDVLGVVRRVQLEYETQWLRDDGTVETRTWTHSEEQVTWWSDDTPYPIRIENTVRRDSPQGSSDENEWDQVLDFTAVQDLIRYEPGTSPIPWSASTQPFRAAHPSTSYATPGIRHPTSGPDSRLPYPFDVAYERVLADASLDGFQQWRRAHPGHLLVGAAFTPDVDPYPFFGLPLPEHPIGAWQFVFADPGPTGATDQAFVVDSTQLAGDVHINRELGSAALAKDLEFTMDDLADPPVTFAWVEQTMDRFLAAQDDAPPAYYIGWGYFASAPGPGPFGQGGDLRIRGNSDSLNVFYADAWRADPQAGPAYLADDAMGYDYAYIIVALDTGNLVMTWTERFTEWYAIGQRLDPDQAIPLEQATRTGGTGAPPPEAVAVFTAASAFAVFLAIYFLPLLKLFGARVAVAIMPGFTKLKSNDVTAHPTRQKALDLIAAEPGISVPQLHKALGGGWSTIVYHVDVLQRHDQITSMIDGRHKRLFPAATIDHGARDKVAALRNERTRQVHALLLSSPGLTQAQVARRLGAAESSVQWHVQRLKNAGLISGQTSGRRIQYYAAPSPLEAIPASA